MAGPSQASILALKAIAAEQQDVFAKEGRSAVKGAARRHVQKSKDPFARPSPGLVKRLAAEARNDAKRRRFNEDDRGLDDEQRRAIMEKKARRYDALRRGDYSGMSEKEMAEVVIDFDRKRDEDTWSDHTSDVDESADTPETMVEYVDELGRTRTGTRAEARAAGQRMRRAGNEVEMGGRLGVSSYASVLESKVVRGDQNFFPVYEPDADALQAKYREAEEESRQHHYDATKEVRARAAGQYQFSLDEEERAKQMASLKAQRQETQRAREDLDRIMAKRKARLNVRQEMLEERRTKMAGGKEALDKLRRDKAAADADQFLEDLEKSMHG